MAADKEELAVASAEESGEVHVTVGKRVLAVVELDSYHGSGLQWEVRIEHPGHRPNKHAHVKEIPASTEVVHRGNDYQVALSHFAVLNKVLSDQVDRETTYPGQVSPGNGMATPDQVARLEKQVAALRLEIAARSQR